MKLTIETMADCLSLLCKTGDGLAHAYVRFDATDRYVLCKETLISMFNMIHSLLAVV